MLRSMRRIPLRYRDGSVRAYALVDDQDYATLGCHRWFLTAGYASRRTPRPEQRIVYLHREVMQVGPGDARQVDHRNLDRLDCRRRNLRVVPRTGNRQNIRARRGSTSRFRGVSWDARLGKWIAEVNAAGYRRWRGRFDSETAAARAADEVRRERMPYALPDPELLAA